MHEFSTVHNFKQLGILTYGLLQAYINIHLCIITSQNNSVFKHSIRLIVDIEEDSK